MGRYTKSISIDHPVLSGRLLRRGGIDVDVVEPCIRDVHQVNSPKRRIHDIEVPDCDIARIPPNKRHWSTWRGDTLVYGVPVVSCTIDAANAPTVDLNVLAAKDDASDMVLGEGKQLDGFLEHFQSYLESNRDAVVGPVSFIGSKLPFAHPVDHDIVELHVNDRRDSVFLSCREDDMTVVAAVVESSEDVWGIILLVSKCTDSAGRATVGWRISWVCRPPDLISRGGSQDAKRQRKSAQQHLYQLQAVCVEE